MWKGLVPNDLFVQRSCGEIQRCFSGLIVCFSTDFMW